MHFPQIHGGLSGGLAPASSPRGGAFGRPRKVNGFARGSPTRGAVERSETERLYEGEPDRKPLLGSTSPSLLRNATARVAAPSVCFAAARILLAAAPTAPPCFRHWRRSSPLLLPRGGLGRAENFSSSPEAPLLGELAAKQTERLYEGKPDLCSKARPFAPRRAFSVQTKADRHANGSPFGGAGERSETERARPLTANPRHSDSIALTKSLPIAAQRLFRAGLALSVIASQCHLSQGERLWQAASFPVSFWRIICYNGFAALPAHLFGRGGEKNGKYSFFHTVCRSKCSSLLHLQVA